MKKFLPVLLIVFSGTLCAQSREFWAEGGASILLNQNIGSPFPHGNANDVKLDDGFRLGFRFDYNSAGRLGHEIQYGGTFSRLSDSTGTILPQVGSERMVIHQFGYNLLYYLDPTENEKMRPFFTVGVHVNNFALPADVQAHSVNWGFNYGGGIKYRLSPVFGLRFDIRGYDTGKPNWDGTLYKQSGILHQTEASIGFGVYF